MIVKKRFLGHDETQGLVNNIIRHLQKHQIHPAAIVGITRGGLTPAVMMSHYFKCPLLTLDYSLRDREGAELNDAATQQVIDTLTGIVGNKHVVVIDDINDSGETLLGIRNLFRDEFFTDANIVYATLLEITTSKFDCDFYGELLMDEQCNDWIVFPWEDWWLNKA